MHNQIDPTREYFVSEIAKNGWMLTERKTKNPRFILRQIEQGKLPAKAVTIGNKIKVYTVLGADIIAFKEKYPQGKRLKKQMKPYEESIFAVKAG